MNSSRRGRRYQRSVEPTVATMRRPTSVAKRRWFHSTNWWYSSWGRSLPWHIGHDDPQPVPEPVTRTIPPSTISTHTAPAVATVSLRCAPRDSLHERTRTAPDAIVPSITTPLPFG